MLSTRTRSPGGRGDGDAERHQFVAAGQRAHDGLAGEHAAQIDLVGLGGDRTRLPCDQSWRRTARQLQPDVGDDLWTAGRALWTTAAYSRSLARSAASVSPVTSSAAAAANHCAASSRRPSSSSTSAYMYQSRIEPGRGRRPVQATAGQHAQRGVELAQVAARAGDDDEQLGPRLGVEPAEVGIGQRSQRRLGRPSARSQSAMTARLRGSPEIRRAVRSSVSASAHSSQW